MNKLSILRAAGIALIIAGVTLMGGHDEDEAGADLLVIGRPITGASDPAGAARQIAADLAAISR